MNLPAQHTVTITTNQTSSENSPVDIHFDKGYFSTLTARILIIELILSIIIILLSGLALFTFFVESAAFLAIIRTLFLLIFNAFHFCDKYDPISSLKCHFITAAIFAILFFVASILCLLTLIVNLPFSLFLILVCVATTMLFAYDAYLKLQELRSIGTS
ncbi:hypothetical protein PGB90_004351 [Kerria lacca]